MSAAFSQTRLAATAMVAVAAIAVVMMLPAGLGRSLLGGHMLSLHLLFEMFAIMIATLVVVTTWHTFDRNRDHSGDVLIAGFVAVGICDVLHVLTFEGMPSFPIEPSIERAIFFWLMSRSFEVVTAGMLAFALAPRLSRLTFLLIGLLAASGTVLFGALALDWFPTTFVRGQGVTPFKAGFELVLIAGNLILAFVFWRKASRQQSARDAGLALSCLLMGLGGFAFTSYVAPSDIQNLAGHTFKVASYAVLFHVTFVAGIRAPYAALQASEEGLRESQSRVECLSSNLPLTVLFQFVRLPDGSSRFTEVSFSIERVLGVSRLEVLRQPDRLFNLVHPEDRAAFNRQALRCARTLSRFDMLCRMCLSPESVRHFRVVAQPRRQDDDRIIWDGILTDKTERVAIENAQRQMEAHLSELQKMESVGTLASGIAHDFNNVLASIMGNVQLAKDDVRSGAADDVVLSLDQIHKACAQAKGLTQQILAFSRREAPDRRPQLLLPIVRESFSLLRSTLPASIELREYVESPHAVALVNKTQLTQVLVNLCTNSWHALGDRVGRITVGLSVEALGVAEARRLGLRPEPHARLWVQDDGCGMAEDVRRRVFEPFFTTKQQGKGTGLGLSVVHRLVVAHDGAITVTSQQGVGSRFEITLPLISHEAPVTDILVTDPVPALAIGMGQGILLVDDNELLGETTSKLLQRHGYAVVFHAEPLAALEDLRRTPDQFQILVTDFNMPQLSGVQLIEAACQVKPDMPSILLSGFIDDDLEAAARRVGIAKVLPKTQAVESLPVLVGEMLREHVALADPVLAG